MASKQLKKITSNKRVIQYLRSADHYLEKLGYTEHGVRHASIVSRSAIEILKKLGYPERECELAAVAGYIHDIGNLAGRKYHGIAASMISERVLEEEGFPLDEIARVMCAVSNHEDEDGHVTDSITAALIIADKADVHRSRVRNTDFISFDIHDRVNYAATDSAIGIDKVKREITLSLSIDTNISQVMEYFEIFLDRMILCRRAANFFGCSFSLVINEVKLL